MSSALHKAIKQVLKEIDFFLTSTLNDSSLNKTIQKEKKKLIDSLQKFYSDYAELKPSLEKDDAKSSTTIQRLSSIGSQPSEDCDSNEDNIPQTTVSALEDPTKLGYLLQRKVGDNKQKLFKQKKEAKKYCVVHENAMYWFVKPSDKTFHGAVILYGCEFRDMSRKDKEFIFQIDFINTNRCFEFKADNKEELEEWKKAVEKGIRCGEEKAAEGKNPYEFDGISTTQTSDEVEGVNITYMNNPHDMDEEENGGFYTEPDPLPSAAKDKITYLEKEKELGSSIPRELPPEPPQLDSVKLPLPKKGKDKKELKPPKAKKVDKVVTLPKTLQTNDSNSKMSPQNNTAKKPVTAKPQTLSEVKLKHVSMPAGMSLVEDRINDENNDELYETIGNIQTAVASSVSNRLSVPASKPPQLPRRHQDDMYENTKDSDHLDYEI